MTPGVESRIATLSNWRIDSPAVLDALRRKVGEREPVLSALVAEPGRFDRLRRELIECPEGGPLERIAVGIKDIFRVNGLATRAGSRLPPEILAGPEAESVKLLKDAGALVLGKTVTTEFAYFAPGPTRNPRAIDHTPGGSSSGSAAAVAAGYCPLALGTQTIGSICRPASYCGVVGFKPTYGRIPLDGVIPLAPTLDHVGIFAGSVADTEIAAAVLCHGWQPPVADRQPNLGIPVGPYLEKADTTGRDLFDRAVDSLRSQEWQISEVEVMVDFEVIEARHWVILAGEMERVHRGWFAGHAELYHPRTRALIERGRAVSDEQLATARIEKETFTERLQGRAAAGGVDLWICPAATGTAPAGLTSTGDPIMNLPWTQAGLPALSLPAGTDRHGLPFGLQVVGAAGSDEVLLRWAGELETALEVVS